MDEDHLSTSPRIVNPSPRTIVMVRHGETEGNLDDKAQGHFDAQLTKRGRLQAEAVAQRLADIEFDVAYSSDLRRAMDTAQAITASRPELKIQIRPQLREYNFGDFEDFPWDDLRDARPDIFQRWKNLDTRASIEFPGGESLVGAWQRVGDFATEILAKHRQGNETILVVGHGGSLQALFGSVAEPPHPRPVGFRVQQHGRHDPRRTPLHTKRLADEDIQRHQPPKRHRLHAVTANSLLANHAIAVTVSRAIH